jgi:predicted hotdog family 3-hydroxylacyl-ACP dehydratase
VTSALEQMLPHKSSMVLVDRLVSSDDHSAIVEATIKGDYPFTGETIGTWVGLELMAQSAAVLANQSKQASSDKASLGFLLGSRSFTAHVPQFVSGQKVTVEIDLDPASEGQIMVNARGRIKDVAGQVICEGMLTLYEPNDDALYLPK